MTTLDDAISQMVAFGLDAQFPEVDGKIKRVKYLQERQKSGWYQLFPLESFVVGSFGSWKVRPEGFKIENRVGFAGFDQKKMDDLMQKMRDDARRKEKELEIDRNEAAKRAIEIWSNSSGEGSSEYLTRKLIISKCAKFWGKTIVVPMHNREGNLRSLQCIKNDGSKKFLPKGEVSGCFCLIEGKGPVAIAEGYATGMSVHMATGFNVAVCFSASNVLKVAPFFRGKKCLVCADDDFKNEFNVGKYYGELAAREINCKLVLPVFKDNRATDFNDLHVSEGLDEVKKQCTI